MANTNYRAVDEYIASRPEADRPVLERVRNAIRKALPEAEEAISYQIPAYKVGGTAAVYFAGWREHYSFYPASDAMLAAFADDLASHTVEKHTIRFSLKKRVPTALLGKLARYRAQEVAEWQQARSAAKKARASSKKAEKAVPGSASGTAPRKG